MDKVIRFFEKLVYTLYGIIKILNSSRFRHKIKKHETKDESCYVLGNGPSLNKDLKECKLSFQSKNLIVVNNFGFSEFYSILKPGFYVLADAAYYVDNIDQQVQLSVDNLFVELKNKTSWPVKLFVPFEGKRKIQDLLKENSNFAIVGYNNVNTWKGFKWFDRWVYDKQWAIFSGINVIIASLYLAITLGFKQIYLFGVDHTWHKNLVVGDDNILYFYDDHFYDVENQKPIPVILEKNNKIIYMKIHEQFDYLKKTFEVYHYLEDYAKYKNVMIYNCTLGSYIDAFTRI